MSTTGIMPLYAEANTLEIYRVPVFVSDPIDVGTQSDSLSPLGLSWKRTNRVTLSKKNYFNLFLRGGGIETVLICSRCSDSSPCLNEGTCLSNSTCDCPTRADFDDLPVEFLGEVVYGGSLCELDCTEQDNSDNLACQLDFNPYDDDEFNGDDGDNGSTNDPNNIGDIGNPGNDDGSTNDPSLSPNDPINVGDNGNPGDDDGSTNDPNNVGDDSPNGDPANVDGGL